MSDIVLNPTAVKIGRFVDGHGELRLVLHEDSNDAHPWKVTGNYGEHPIAEEFSHPPHLYCYVAALIETWYDGQADPPPASEVTGSAAREFLAEVTRAVPGATDG